MSSAALIGPRTAGSPLTRRTRSVTLVDVAVALAAFVASLALSSGHVSALRPGPTGLDWLSAVLLAGTTLPLIAWRRSPCAVFALTASASVLLGGLGYSIGLLVGPTVALYLWAASRENTNAWTRRDTEIVGVLFTAYLGASTLGDHGAPGIELLH